MIKHRLIIGVVIFVIGCNLNAVSASENEGCFSEMWKKLASKDEEKAFDVQNDFDKHGVRYSCDAYTTPTKMVEFLKNISAWISDKDSQSISNIVNYPIRIKVAGDYVGKAGVITQNSITARNKNEFVKMFNDKIYTQELADVFKCARLKNIWIDSSQGVAIANGGVWLYVDPDTHKIYINNLSADIQSLRKWIQSECNK